MKKTYVCLLHPIQALILTVLISSCSKNNDFTNISNQGTAQDSSQVNSGNDQRKIENGFEIYDATYVDQPYVLQLPDKWICIYTMSPKGEGETGEHVSSSISYDQGQSWIKGTNIEPSNINGPSSFYAVPYLTSSGRIYVFYGYNKDNVPDSLINYVRTDMVGVLAFKYSDDNGLTWSNRYEINLPVTHVDLLNPWHGKYQSFWTICKPITANNQMYFAITKNSTYSEGRIVNCPNINTEQDADKLIWNVYPGGDRGIHNYSFSSYQTEFNLVQINANSFACVNRTEMGFPAISYSTDTCKTWSLPVEMKYGSGNIIKNPIACARIFKCSNGNYILWYHNNGTVGYAHRNPVWVSGGVANNGTIIWSQPEILLYSPDTTTIISYPDLIENNGHYWVTETQKRIARIHEVDSKLLNGLWNQAAERTIISNGLMMNYSSQNNSNIGKSFNLGSFQQGAGETIDLDFVYSASLKGQTILSCKDSTNSIGFDIGLTTSNSAKLTLYDGVNTPVSFETGINALVPGQKNRVAFVVDGLSKVMTVMVNGVLWDGGTEQKFGWKFLSPIFGAPATVFSVIPSALKSSINSVRVYDRYLTTSELLSNYMAD